LQAQELPVKVGQLEIGGRLGLVYSPEAGGLDERCHRGRDNGLSMQEYRKPYHYEAHTFSPEFTHPIEIEKFPTASHGPCGPRLSTALPIYSIVDRKS